MSGSEEQDAPAKGNAVPLSVILADSQVLFRTGAARALQQDVSVQLRAVCKDTAELMSAVASHPASVVLLASDLAPDIPALMAAIRDAGGSAVLVADRADALDASVAAMADGVVSRSIAGDQLLQCVHRVAAGGRWMDTNATEADPVVLAHGGERAAASLTPKELQIVGLVADGSKNRDIASQLGTTEQVIKNYLRSIYDKTGVSDRLELSLFSVHHAAMAEAVKAARGSAKLPPRKRKPGTTSTS